jgi:general secretion pathway protein G
MNSMTETHERPAEAGYTLTELLIVLAVLALLVVVIAPQLTGGFSRARSDVANLQMKKIQAALDLYSVDAGTFPKTEHGLRALIEKPQGVDRWRGPYLPAHDDIRDPWGTEFHYVSPGAHGPYDLFSNGADGAEGGEGDAADVRSW